MEKTIKLAVAGYLQIDSALKLYEPENYPKEHALYVVKGSEGSTLLAMRSNSSVYTMPLQEEMFDYLEVRNEAPTPEAEIISTTMELIGHKLRELKEAIDRRGISEETVVKIIEAVVRDK